MNVLVMARIAASPMSSGAPIRRAGLRSVLSANSLALASSPSASQAPVSTTPGEIALTRIGASSTASDRVGGLRRAVGDRDRERARLDVERRDAREDDDRPAVVDLAPERPGEHQRPDDLGVERAPHGVAIESSSVRSTDSALTPASSS